MAANQVTDQSAEEQPAESPSIRPLIIDTMLGWTGHHSRSQGEQLLDSFRGDGLRASGASSRRHRVLRLVDMLWSVWRHRQSVDVVSIALFSGPAFRLGDATARLTNRLGIPTVLVLHGGALPDYANAHPDRVRALLSRADVVVAPSKYNAEALAPFSKRPIAVIPNLVAMPIGDSPPRDDLRPTVFWMRSLHQIYGPEIAIDVIGRVARSYPKVRLTMAGPDKADLLDGLQAKISALQLNDNVELVGFLDAEAKAAAFGDHDIFLNTSRVDNTPVSLLEAAASGQIVISTDAGGIPALFTDGQNALLCPVDDIETMAQSIVDLLDEPERAKSLAKSGRELALSMSWEAIRPQWLAAFELAVSRHQERNGLPE